MGCSLTFALDHLKVFWYTFLSFFVFFFVLLHFLCYFIVFQFYFPLFYGSFLDLDLRQLEGISIYIIMSTWKIEGLSHRTPYTNTQKPTSSSSSNAFTDNMNYLPWSIHPSINRGAWRKKKPLILKSLTWYWFKGIQKFLYAHLTKFAISLLSQCNMGIFFCMVNPQGGAIPKILDLEEGRRVEYGPTLGNVFHTLDLAQGEILS